MLEGHRRAPPPPAHSNPKTLHPWAPSLTPAYDTLHRRQPPSKQLTSEAAGGGVAGSGLLQQRPQAWALAGARFKQQIDRTASNDIVKALLAARAGHPPVSHAGHNWLRRTVSAASVASPHWRATVR